MDMDVKEAKIVIFCNRAARRAIEIAAEFGYSPSWTYGTLGIMEYKGYLKKFHGKNGMIYKVTNPEIYTKAVSILKSYNNALKNNTPENKDKDSEWDIYGGGPLNEPANHQSNQDSQESKEQ